MKTKVYEKDIEEAARRYALTLGYIVYKFESPGNNGVPDRIFINRHGITIYIEFKAPGRTATHNQTKQIEKIKHQGAPVYLRDNLKQTMELLEVWSDKVDVHVFKG